jgi:hypothetical protein
MIPEEYQWDEYHTKFHMAKGYFKCIQIIPLSYYDVYSIILSVGMFHIICQWLLPEDMSRLERQGPRKSRNMNGLDNEKRVEFEN